MKSKLQTILNKPKFFNIINSTNSSISYSLEKSSWLLIRNIYINWLQYLNFKTQKVMPIYIQKGKSDPCVKSKVQLPPFGIIKHNEYDFKNKTLQYVFDNPVMKIDLELKLMVPRQDVMQYFIQWQRYRKYWWSSITTTPSLFSIGDMKQENEVDIVAKLPCGPQTVEHVKIKNHDSEFNEGACLTCTMSLERALLILLLDGLSNDSIDGYLRLHRKIAPYKMSFALEFEETKKKDSLKELAALLYHRLSLERITASLPDFSISLEDQLKENLQLGVPYTAILSETSLQNGILHLMNSSTTLKEQLHVADFHTYAAQICSNK